MCEVGIVVDLYDVMGLVGCKFLFVGKGGFNFIYGEGFEDFVGCYGEWVGEVVDWLCDFDVEVLCVWVDGLGVEIFVGSFGCVFLVDMKVVFLLCCWVCWLYVEGVCFYMYY